MSYTTDCYSTEVKLSSTLLNSSRYNPVIPITDSGTGQGYVPTVYISFILVKFLSLTSDTRVMSVQGALDMYWTDPQLSWNKNQYACVSRMPFFAYTVWHPYVFLKGASGATFRFSMDDYDIIRKSTDGSSNGRIYGLFQSSCSMNFLYYPFDSQVCYLKFINYDFPWIQWAVLGDGVYTISSEATTSSDWSITEFNANKSDDSVCLSSGCQSLMMFKVTFNFQRKSGYLIMNVVAPTVIMWVMISLTFVLPSDRGMKVPLAATLMLAIYTQQRTVSSLLPNASPTPYISQIYLIGIYLSALSLITAVLTILMRVLAPTLPPAVQSFMINVVGRLCCQGKPRVAPKPNSSKDLEVVEVGENSAKSSTDERLERLDSHIVELIEIKREKMARAQANAANENAWQKIEFVFNGVLLLAYTATMTVLFITFSSGGSSSLL